ncbi:MAG: GNAT family N-acetyltransferase [Thiomonas sp.]|uniref:GNAT family N-acetyltransferase n=1 Tax=Thiomonas sp. TaxID=2047785 RepID=UPI002A361CBF|nr:GNAT family N-acetyltransferase [Thiomonas sp.]MDY0329014.1 GNAT family N-acetyltransferase [Thiomonas sp.]
MTEDFRTELSDAVSALPAADWERLVGATPGTTPFQRHAWLSALEQSGCVGADTGWQSVVIALRDKGGTPAAACALYVKSHSYGEYVFDWAWARAYAEHGLPYYPKLLLAVPFTPVGGAKLLGRDASARQALLREVLAIARRSGFSSFHALFLDPLEARWCAELGLLERTTLQFHWRNPPADGAAPWPDFEAFLASLRHDKRKKIKQEQRQVRDAGVTFRALPGAEITASHWDFFTRCYDTTYALHGSEPYLNRRFFHAIGAHMPEHCLLFVAQRGDQPVASSLVVLDPQSRIAYGRYWGAVAHIPALHFDACYYQPIAWCLAHGYTTFEGGAQGEHKMARGLQPVATRSAHWLAQPQFARAVQDYLQRETAALAQHRNNLQERLPFKEVQ